MANSFPRHLVSLPFLHRFAPRREKLLAAIPKLLCLEVQLALFQTWVFILRQFILSPISFCCFFCICHTDWVASDSTNTFISSIQFKSTKLPCPWSAEKCPWNRAPFAFHPQPFLYNLILWDTNHFFECWASPLTYLECFPRGRTVLLPLHLWLKSSGRTVKLRTPFGPTDERRNAQRATKTNGS